MLHCVDPTLPKHVSFRSEISEIFPLTACQEREFWYQQKEIASFCREGIQTAKLLKHFQGNITRLDPANYCVRGLEKWISREYARQRRVQHRAVIHTVLKAQGDQRLTGISDPESIRGLYMMLSKVSRDRAIEMANLDARACAECVLLEQSKSTSSGIRNQLSPRHDQSNKRQKSMNVEHKQLENLVDETATKAVPLEFV